jgi:hypothetical protein
MRESPHFLLTRGLKGWRQVCGAQTRSSHAARPYSCMRPPRRSRRFTASVCELVQFSSAGRPFGGASSKLRWGGSCCNESTNTANVRLRCRVFSQCAATSFSVNSARPRGSDCASRRRRAWANAGGMLSLRIGESGKALVWMRLEANVRRTTAQ